MKNSIEESLQKKVVSAIRNSDTHTALKLLKDTRHHLRASLLLSRYKRLEDRKIKGIISYSDYEIQVNSISEAVLNLVTNENFNNFPRLNIWYVIALFSCLTLVLGAILLGLIDINSNPSFQAKDSVVMPSGQKKNLEKISLVIGGILSNDDKDSENFQYLVNEFESLYYTEGIMLSDSTLIKDLIYFKNSINDYKEEYISENQFKQIGISINLRLKTFLRTAQK